MGSARLTLDQLLVRSRFPELTFQVEPVAKCVAINGILTIRGESGVPEYIATRIELPYDYPEDEPIAYDVASRFLHDADHHFFSNGRCCLWLPPESRWAAADPMGLPHFLFEVAAFFERQLIAELVGYFPGQQRGHGADGYLEYVLELLNGDERLMARLVPVLTGTTIVACDEPCPCGSAQVFAACHSRWIENLRATVGQEWLRAVFTIATGPRNHRRRA